MASKTVPVSEWEEGTTHPKTLWEFVRYSQYARGTPTMAEIRQLVVRVPCAQLVPNGRSARGLITEEQIVRMAKSIQSEGVVTPLWVYRLGDGRFRVFDGDIRLLGALRCDADGTLPEGTVPVHVYPYADYVWLIGQANNVDSPELTCAG